MPALHGRIHQLPPAGLRGPAQRPHPRARHQHRHRVRHPALVDPAYSGRHSDVLQRPLPQSGIPGRRVQADCQRAQSVRAGGAGERHRLRVLRRGGQQPRGGGAEQQDHFQDAEQGE